MIKNKRAQMSTTMMFVIGFAVVLILLLVIKKFLPWTCEVFGGAMFYCP